MELYALLFYVKAPAGLLSVTFCDKALVIIWLFDIDEFSDLNTYHMVVIYSEASIIRNPFIRKPHNLDQFSLELKQLNIILYRLTRNPRFRNRTVVLETKPCFTMTIGRVFDFQLNVQLAV